MGSHSRYRSNSLNLPRFSSPLTLPPIIEEDERPPHVPVPHGMGDVRRPSNLVLGEPPRLSYPVGRKPILESSGRREASFSSFGGERHGFTLDVPREVQIASLKEFKAGLHMKTSFLDFRFGDSDTEGEDAEPSRSTGGGSGGSMRRVPIPSPPPNPPPPPPPSVTTRQPETDARILVQMAAHSRAVSASQKQQNRKSVGADRFDFQVPGPTRSQFMIIEPRPKEDLSLSAPKSRRSVLHQPGDRVLVGGRNESVFWALIYCLRPYFEWFAKGSRSSSSSSGRNLSSNVTQIPSKKLRKRRREPFFIEMRPLSISVSRS